MQERSAVRSLLVNAALFGALGLDTLAVAIGLGLSGLSSRERVRLGVAFAGAEGLMPLVGFATGNVIATRVGTVASYVAVVLLFGVGLYAIWEALHDTDEEESNPRDHLSLPRLAVLALSISLDELAVGFSIGLLHVPIALAIAYIVAQAFVVTLVGTTVGRRLGEVFAERAELLSGLVLCGLAVFLLLERVSA